MSNMQYRPSLEELKGELQRIRGHKTRRRWMAAFLTVLVVAVVAGSYLSSSHFTLMRVSGPSMENTLRAGDVVLCQKDVPLTRGDVVAFERDGTLLIKRIIATEGDQVQIKFDGQVAINGVEIEERYVFSETLGSGDMVYPITVPAGQVFVMGDHRSVSVDSRDSSLGMVSLREVIGRVEALIWPMKRISRM